MYWWLSILVFLLTFRGKLYTLMCICEVGSSNWEVLSFSSENRTLNQVRSLAQYFICRCWWAVDDLWGGGEEERCLEDDLVTKWCDFYFLSFPMLLTMFLPYWQERKCTTKHLASRKTDLPCLRVLMMLHLLKYLFPLQYILRSVL